MTPPDFLAENAKNPPDQPAENAKCSPIDLAVGALNASERVLRLLYRKGEHFVLHVDGAMYAQEAIDKVILALASLKAIQPTGEARELVRRLRLHGPDDAPVDPKANYATKPRALLDAAADALERQSTPALVAEGARFKAGDIVQWPCGYPRSWGPPVALTEQSAAQANNPALYTTPRLVPPTPQPQQDAGSGGCTKDGQPCLVGKGTEDEHWRCGTFACGRAAAPQPEPSEPEGGEQ